MKKILTDFSLCCLVFILMIVSGIQNARAQTKPAAVAVVRGKVTDKGDKQPVIGASVVELDNEKRTIGGISTDIDGNYVLKISNPNNRISFSLIGYKTVVLNISGRTAINVQLEASSNELTEVAITARKPAGNGLLQIDARNSTSAVARINAKDLEEMSSASIDQALQGRLPGVDIAAMSGDPGAGMQIRIRGTSTINGATDPLIVVDGMPYDTDVPEDFNFGTADEQGYATLLNISPADIQDISVLKDAAATAVWGSRAANGVLIINTKRGRLGKPQVTYTLRGTMQKQPSPIPMLTGNQFSMLIPEAFMNRNGVPLNTETVKEFQYDPSDPYYYYNYSNNTNWISEITRTGYKQDHNISMNGGGEKARYYASVGYLGETGTSIGTGLGRISTKINLDYNVSDRIRFRTDLSYTHTATDKTYLDETRDVAYRKMPNMGVYEYDAQGNNTGVYLSPVENIQGSYSGTYNPVAMLNNAKNRVTEERIMPVFAIQYDLKPSVFKAMFDVQFDIKSTKNKSFLPQIATGRPISETVVNSAYDGDADKFGIQTKTSFMYTPKLSEKHSFSGLLMFQTNDNTSNTHQEQTSNSASVELQDPSDPSRQRNISAPAGRTRTVAALVNGQYSYLDRYIINGSLRVDGNSKFGLDNRYGLFPAISTRWRVSGEPFMQRFKFISDLSLRAGYGQSGNAPKDNYAFYSKYQSFSYDYMGSPAIYSSSIELRNLKWETVTGKNLGLTMSLFNNRLDLDIDVYRNRTTNLYFPDLSIPTLSGYSSINMNVGTMDNQGWEINLNTTAYKNKNWIVGVNFNFSRNVNIIREISEFYPTEQGRTDVNGEYKRFLKINNPFGSFYGYHYEGVYKDKDATVATDKNGNQIVGADGLPVYMRFNYPSTDYVFQPGDAKYKDINHDGNIDYMDIQYLGNGNPKFIGGFGPDISYKGILKLTAFFSFRYKYDVVNRTMMNTTNMYGFDNQSTAVLRRWRNEGDVTDIPRALYGSGYNWLGSDRYVEDASFVRLRATTLRYNLQKSLLDRLGMKSFGIYVTAENLITFTNYKGQDPEVSPKLSSPFSIIEDKSMTPPSRNFILGITAGF